MSDNISSKELPRGVLYEKQERKETRPQSGFVFLCSNQTERECLDSRVFGLPKSMQDRASQVRKGDVLFLLNYQSNHLHGVFEAVSDGGMNMVPYAFGGRFPAQVRVKRKINCSWVDKGALLPLIKRRLILVSRRGVLIFPDKLSPHTVDELYRIFLGIPPAFRTGKEKNSYQAKDGHFTRSYGERHVDNWLHEHLPYNHLYSFPREQNEEVIRCDWYVTDLNLHIEYWDAPDSIHPDAISVKHRFYTHHSLKVVNLYECDLPYLDRVIPERIAALVRRCRFKKLARRHTARIVSKGKNRRARR